MASQIVTFVIKNDISGQRKTVAVSDRLLANENSATEDATEQNPKSYSTNKPKLPLDASIACCYLVFIRISTIMFHSSGTFNRDT